MHIYIYERKQSEKPSATDSACCKPHSSMIMSPLLAAQRLRILDTGYMRPSAYVPATSS